MTQIGYIDNMKILNQDSYSWGRALAYANEVAERVYPLFLWNKWTYYNGEIPSPQMLESAIIELMKRAQEKSWVPCQTGRFCVFYDGEGTSKHGGFQVFLDLDWKD